METVNYMSPSVKLRERTKQLENKLAAITATLKEVGLEEHQQEDKVDRLALSFPSDPFYQPSFDVPAFITRQSIPLSTLHQDLIRFQSLLQRELVELVNKEYTQYLQLSSSLADLDTILSQIRDPLCILEREVSTILHFLDALSYEWQQVMEEHNHCRVQKEDLQAICEVSAILAKVDHKNAQHMEGDELIKLCSDYNRIHYILDTHPSISPPDKVLGKTRRFKATLLEAIKGVFLSALADQHQDRVQIALQCYISLKSVDSAEEVWGKYVTDHVLPLVQSLPSQDDLLAGLSHLYQQVYQWIQEDQSWVVRSISTSPFRFITCGFFPAFISALFDVGHDIFTIHVDQLDRYVQLYRVTFQFISQLEALLHEKKRILAFRSSKSYVSFLAKWKFDAFYQLRLKETVKHVEEAEARLKEKQELPMYLSSVHDIVMNVFDPPLWIPFLASKYVELSMRVINRCCHVVEEHSEGSDPLTWMKELVSLQQRLAASITQQLQDPILSDVGKEAASLLSSGTRGLSQRVSVSVSGGVQQLAEDIGKPCISSLEAMRGITATYRMTSKPMPTRSSLYTKKVFQPLQQHLLKMTSLPLDTRKGIASQVEGMVMGAFSDRAKDIMEGLKKTESFLARIHDSDSDQNTDEEKIGKQLELDQQALSTSIQSILATLT